MKKIIYIIILSLLVLASPLAGQPKTTAVGITLIKYYEGFRAQAYLCPASVWTIGHGHTGNDVYPGLRITKIEGERLLRSDLTRFENYVDRTIERQLRWHEFDAVVSFTFNLGYRINDELKYALDLGNTKIVVMKIMQYNKAKVKGRYIILSGLVNRRKAEIALYRNQISDGILQGVL